MAVRANLAIDRGADFTVTLTITDQNGNTINLSGYTGFSSIRKTYTSINATANFAVNIVSNSILNQIVLTLPANTSLGINSTGRYVYDVIVQAPNTGLITRMVEGVVTIRPGVTVTSNAFFPANVIHIDATSNLNPGIVGPLGANGQPDNANNAER